MGVSVPRPVGFGGEEDPYYVKYTMLWSECLLESDMMGKNKEDASLLRNNPLPPHLKSPGKWLAHGMMQAILDCQTRKGVIYCKELLAELRKNFGDAKLDITQVLPAGHPGPRIHAAVFFI